MKNENFAKSNDLKVLQNDIKNIKKLKDNNKRSKSVPGFNKW